MDETATMEGPRLARPEWVHMAPCPGASLRLRQGDSGAPAYPVDGEHLPWRRNVVLLATDTLSLVGSAAAGFTASAVMTAGGGWAAASAAGSTVAVSLLAFAVSGLYATVPMAPMAEVRTLIRAVSLAWGILALEAALRAGGAPLRLLDLSTTWMAAIVLVPLGRATARSAFGKARWWACPVVVLGTGEQAVRIVRTLRRRPELGLRAAFVLGARPTAGGEIDGVTVLGNVALAPRLCRHAGVRIAIVGTSDFGKDGLTPLLDRYASSFERILVIPDLCDLDVTEVVSRDVGGVVGLEVRHRLLAPWRQHLKRALDVGLTLVGSILLLPLVLAIALWIKVDSPGPVLYRQYRLGKDGRCFQMLKFRSMYVGAHDRLRSLLERDDAARREYERYCKLRDDPRVTRVGRVLRRYSLDELPQLWNVLRGQMSLAGPRAYLPGELPRMAGRERVILRVRPGISGYWQVMGRNDVSFETRLQMDLHYIHNWFLSSDLYLLARTLPVVLFGKGAS